MDSQTNIWLGTIKSQLKKLWFKKKFPYNQNFSTLIAWFKKDVLDLMFDLTKKDSPIWGKTPNFWHFYTSSKKIKIQGMIIKTIRYSHCLIF